MILKFYKSKSFYLVSRKICEGVRFCCIFIELIAEVVFSAVSVFNLLTFVLFKKLGPLRPIGLLPLNLATCCSVYIWVADMFSLN